MEIISIQSNLYKRSPRQSGHLCIAANEFSPQLIYWYNGTLGSGQLSSAASGQAKLVFWLLRAATTGQHTRWMLCRGSCLHLAGISTGKRRSIFAGFVNSTHSTHSNASFWRYWLIYIQYIVWVFFSDPVKPVLKTTSTLHKGQCQIMAVMDGTSQERPPVHNGHHFLLPKLTAIDKFDCNARCIENTKFRIMLYT